VELRESVALKDGNSRIIGEFGFDMRNIQITDVMKCRSGFMRREAKMIGGVAKHNLGPRNTAAELLSHRLQQN
jgi:hypothetical protein